MLTIKEIKTPGYEKVVEGIDTTRGLHCFIAVHSCTLGPSLGGTRIHKYRTPEEGLQDALRLAKAMTYKSAIAENGLGGGKSVIIANPHTEKTPELLHAFAEVVDSLKGMYIAAEDVGSNTNDMFFINQKTPYVAAVSNEKSSGDPSPFTAWGVFRGLQAVAYKLWKSPSLANKTIAIQGLGNVGSKLASLLFWEGAHLVVSDIDADLVRQHVHDFAAKSVAPLEIFKQQCDIFSPCAMGAIINNVTIPQLCCQAVAGAANNQLATSEDALSLKKKGILYAPDYIINAGGVINVAAEFEPGGYNAAAGRYQTNRIYDHLLKIFDKAEHENKTANEVANEIAEYNLHHGIGKRKQPIPFKK